MQVFLRFDVRCQPKHPHQLREIPEFGKAAFLLKAAAFGL